MRSAERRRHAPTDSGSLLISRKPASSRSHGNASAPGRDFSRIPVSQPHQAHEQEARRMAERMAHGDASWTTSMLAEQNVRVHTGAHAAASAEALGAKAYTVGNDIVFGAGRFAPHAAEGRRLIAHELVHVGQQRATGQRRIDRDPLPESELLSQPEPTLDELLAEIAAQTAENLRLRAEADASGGASTSSDAGNALNAGREKLFQLLNQRVDLLELEIDSLLSQMHDAGMMSDAADPQSEVLALKKDEYEKELAAHRDQLRSLQRWKKRQRMASIDEELAAIDGEIAALPAGDADPSLLELRAQQREELMLERKKLAKELTSTAREYEQFDKRWGKKHYGPAPACSNVKTGGCGPVSLAMALNFLYAEDPEVLAPQNMEILLPTETVPYAETNGRVCGHGTNGELMVTQMHTRWPGYRGRAITLDAAEGAVRGGTLVIFLCKNCRGTKRNGQPRSYEGHFMVLNGVDDAGKIFNVLDSGDNEANDIQTITKDELKAHGKAYWVVEKK